MAFKYFSLLFISIILISHYNFVKCESDEIVSARVESCKGCSLNRLPEVKKFIFEDLPHYYNVEFKHIQGAVPEILFLNENDHEVERMKLSNLNREECNNLLESKGFKKKLSNAEL